MPPLSVSLNDVAEAAKRISPFVPETPLRNYPVLDDAVGHGMEVWVKHENHHPTNAFKARNAMSALTALSPGQRKLGVIAASRGNHGQGLAWAGQKLGVPVVICVPGGNSPEKNLAMQSFGAEVIIQGQDYDASAEVASELAESRGLFLVHSTNNPNIIAGAGTMTLEILEQVKDIEAMVISVGGGSQAAGAISVIREKAPHIKVFGVQAEGASAIHDSWHAGRPIAKETALTFADGLATRNCYEGTFETLRSGLSDFVTVTEGEIADAIRTLFAATHNIAEGAGAASFAGLTKIGNALAGKRVVTVISGGNIDTDVLQKVLNREL